MRGTNFIPPSFLTLLSIPPTIHAQRPPTHLIAPALLPYPSNITTIQCINITLPFTKSLIPGISGSQTVTLPTVNSTYTIIPRGLISGVHNAPAPQLVHFLNGRVHITLPQDPDGEGLWITGGKGGLLYAADTAGMGHGMMYTRYEVTVAIVMDFEVGVVPEFSIIKEGGCEGVQGFL